MHRKKTGMAADRSATGSKEEQPESLLLSVARTVGSTIGAAAGRAGEAADDLMTLSKAAQTRALGAARTARKHVNKTVRELVARSKKTAKKPHSRKRKSRSVTGSR